MGLAFDLSADDIGSQTDWFNLFLTAQNTLQEQIPTTNLFERWTDIVIDPAEFDIRIRKVFDSNGSTFVVGSYRGEFTENPHSITDFQFAWDGFIALNRSFKWGPPLDESYNGWKARNGSSPFAPDPMMAWLILPMRMPYEWCPGGTAAEIAADDTVGLYSIDASKDLATVMAFQSTLTKAGTSQVAACGFGRIDGTVEGALSDQDYVGAYYTFPIEWQTYITLTEGGNPGIPMVGGRWAESLKSYNQYTWKATEPNHTNNTPLLARFNGRDLNLWVTNNTDTQPIPESVGPPDVTDQLVATRGYYPRRFLDLASVVMVPTWEIGAFRTGGPMIVVGDCCKDDGAGAVDYTTPFTMAGLTFSDPYGSTANPMCVLTARTDENIQLEATVPSYDLNGAWFSHVLPMSDFILNDITVADTSIVPTLFAAENVLHDGDRKAEIYCMSGSPGSQETAWINGQYPYRGGFAMLPGDISIGPYAISGGAWEVATGLTLPDRWVARCQQMRTFTREEENLAKTALLVPADGVNYTPVDQNNVLVGLIGNYPRYGAPNATDQLEISPGTNNKIAMGLLGYSGSVGSRTPFALMFDVGSISFNTTDVTAPFDFTPTGAFTDQASALEGALDTADADAVIVSGDWDNDRDQWLFTLLRPTVGKMAILSVASDFLTFIDQSDKIAIETGVTGASPPAGYQIFEGGVYKSRLMTNELDGLIIGGVELDVAGPGFTLGPTIVGAAPGLPVFNSIYVAGTTGRTARVWIDYVLYDGSEALIAVKLANLGLRVNPENVEWFKARILNNLGVDQLDMKTEEIEAWMEGQSKQYRDILRTKERSGRLRRRKAQVSSYLGGIDGAILDAHGLSIDNSGEPQGLDPEGIEELLKNMDPSKLPPDVDES